MDESKACPQCGCDCVREILLDTMLGRVVGAPWRCPECGWDADEDEGTP